MEARERLRALASRAGYSRTSLQLLAEATLPQYSIGDRLDSCGLATLCAAVETLSQGGATDQEIPELVAHYVARWGEDWREQFWRSQLRIATWRYNHPELYEAPTSSRSVSANVADDSGPIGPGVLAIHPAVAAAPILRRTAA